MELFIGKQLQTAAYSFILGLIFGGLYDIIRIAHILFGIASYVPGKLPVEERKSRGIRAFLLFFLLDAAYMLTVTAVFSVFLYWQMNGKFRLFVLLSAAAGFAVWYATAGRGIMRISEAFVRLLRLAVHFAVIRPLRFLAKLLRKLLAALYRRTAGRIVRLLRHGLRSLRAAGIRRKFAGDIGLHIVTQRKVS